MSLMLKMLNKIIKNKYLIAFISGVVVYDIYKFFTVGIHGIEWIELVVGVFIIILSIINIIRKKEL